jgi:DNA helicase-2/ATP-dependent DNA helicase PcrA
LDENHRSTATVVSLANAIAAPLSARPASWTSNPAGPAARVYAGDDEQGEAGFVAAEVASLLHSGEIAQPGQVGALFRTNAQARALADALRGRGIAVQLRPDLDLFTRAEVRDVVAYLRLAHNPGDGPAFARVLDTPPRHLRAVERAYRKQPVPVAELALYAQRRGGQPAREAIELFLTLLHEMHVAAQDQPPVRVLETVLASTGYAVWLAAQRDGPARMQHVEQLHVLLEHASAPDLATWLADLHLGELEALPNDNAVSLLTVHASKGKEWPVVFVVGVEEGLLPHLRPSTRSEAEPDDSEERRLTYVALSRCQVQLYLTYCRTRRPIVGGQPGRPEPRRPSRYLAALPASLVHPVA